MKENLLELAILGPPRVLWRGQPLEVDTRKATALLVYLAVTRRVHQRHALAYLLWPDATEKRAHSALSRTLSVLHHALSQQGLELGRTEVGLAARCAYDLDLESFYESLIGCAQHKHEPQLECIHCYEHIHAGIAMVRGSLMQGFALRQAMPFEEWLQHQREECKNTYIQALHWMMQWYRRDKDVPKAIQMGFHVLAIAPLHEPTHRQMMRLYVAQGQSQKAIVQYQSLEKQLQRSWGLLPEPKTIELFESIQREPTTSPKIWTSPSQELSSDGLISIEVEANAEPDKSSSARPNFAMARNLLHRLPPQTTPFIGRNAEQKAITECISKSDARLATLVGPGGIGKTRLATHLAAQLHPQFPHGVWFFPLAEINTADALLTRLAELLQFTPNPAGDLASQLWNFLSQKELLLILDNFEQLHAAIPTLQQLLAHTKKPKLLVTSREKLQIQEEWVIVLEGLQCPLPGSTQQLSPDAVEFFLQCAMRIDARFSPTPEESEDIAHICWHVGGSPLCIELAASWLRMMSCREIRESLQHNDELLISSYRDLPDRQQSQRRVFEATWELLHPQERQGFAQLSVFRGGFTYQAARKVTAASLPILLRLLDRFLLQRQPDGRFQIHPLLRQYAAEKCEALFPEAQNALHRNHAQYYLAPLASRFDELWSPSQPETLRQLDEERENTLQAWRWALQHSQTQLICDAVHTLAHFYELRGWLREAYQIFSDAAALQTISPEMETPLHSVWLQFYRGMFALLLGQQEQLEASYEQVQQLLSIGTSVTPLTEGARFQLLGMLDYKSQRYEDALVHFQQSLQEFERADASAFSLKSLAKLSELARRQGSSTAAHEYSTKSLEIAKSLGAPWALADSFNQLGILAGMMGQHAQAKYYFEESQQHYLALGSSFGLARVMHNLGTLAFIQKDYKSSYTLRQECLSYCRDLGTPIEIARALAHLGSATRKLKRYEEADQYCLESLQIAQQLQDLSAMIQALGALVYNSIEQHQISQAQQYLYEAMLHAQTLQFTPVSLHLLSSFAQLLLTQQEIPRAVEILRFLQTQDACDTQTKNHIEEQLALHLPTQAPETPNESEEAQETSWQIYFNQAIQELHP